MLTTGIIIVLFFFLYTVYKILMEIGPTHPQSARIIHERTPADDAFHKGYFARIDSVGITENPFGGNKELSDSWLDGWITADTLDGEGTEL